MDATIKQVISGFELGLNSYKEKLGDSNEKLKKALALYDKLLAAAEKARDMTDFYATPESGQLMSDLSAMLPELSQEKPVHGIRTSPPASQVAAGYHMAYDQMPKDDPATNKVYERVFELEKQSENAAVFMRLMAEEGLFVKMASVPLVSRQDALIANAKGISQPVMVNFHEKTRAKMQAARSTAEVEFETNLEAEISIYQNLWDTQFLSCTEILLGNAISSWMLTHSEDDRQEVENGYRFIAGYFGVDFDRLFKVPADMGLLHPGAVRHAAEGPCVRGRRLRGEDARRVQGGARGVHQGEGARRNRSGGVLKARALGPGNGHERPRARVPRKFHNVLVTGVAPGGAARF